MSEKTDLKTNLWLAFLGAVTEAPTNIYFISSRRHAPREENPGPSVPVSLVARERYLEAFKPLVGCIIARERAQSLEMIALEKGGCLEDGDHAQVEEDLRDHGMQFSYLSDKGTKATWLPLRDSLLFRHVTADETMQMDLINFARDYALIAHRQVACRQIGGRLFLADHFTPGLPSAVKTINAIMGEIATARVKTQPLDEQASDRAWWAQALSGQADFIRGLGENEGVVAPRTAEIFSFPGRHVK